MSLKCVHVHYDVTMYIMRTKPNQSIINTYFFILSSIMLCLDQYAIAASYDSQYPDHRMSYNNDASKPRSTAIIQYPQNTWSATFNTMPTVL